MKALITRNYRHGDQVYKLRAGEEAPEMPAGLKKALKDAGYIGKSPEKAKVATQEVIIDQQEHNIEEEELFVNTVREEDE